MPSTLRPKPSAHVTSAIKLRRTLLAPATLAARLGLTPNQVATLKCLHERPNSSKNRKAFYRAVPLRKPTVTKPGKLPTPDPIRIPASFPLFVTKEAEAIITALIKKGQSKLRVESAGLHQPARLFAVSGKTKTLVGELRMQRLPANPASADSTVPAIRIDATGSKISVTHFVPKSPMQLRNPLTIHEGPLPRIVAGPKVANADSATSTSKGAKTERSARNGTTKTENWP